MSATETLATTTQFRRGMQQLLSTELEVPFVGGPVRTIGQENRALGCMWLETKTPMPADGNMEQITYGVRLFRNWRQEQGDDVQGRNVEQLELDVELLQTAFRAVLLHSDFAALAVETRHDFFNVAGVSPNYEAQYVEAALTAFQRNMGARGG